MSRMIDGSTGRSRLWLATGLTLLLATGAAAQTFRQTAIWKNDVIFWEHVVRRDRQANLGTFTSLWNLVDAYKQSGRHEEMEQAARVMIDSFPYRGDGYYQAALSRVLRRDHATALELLDRALQLKPDMQAALTLRGTVNLSLGRVSAAEADWTSVIERWPQDPEAYLWRGRLYKRTGRLDLAEADFRTARHLGYFDTQR